MGFLQPQDDRLEKAYKEPFGKWQRNPSKHNTATLLKAITPEIDRGLSAHVGQSNALLRSRAKKMTLDSLHRYDSKQSKLGTYVVNTLQGLKRVNRQQTSILRVPERVALDRSQLQKAESELGDNLGREPSTQELSDHMGLSIKRIHHIRKFRPEVSEGFLASIESEDGGAGGVMPTVDHASTAWEELVYTDLNKTDQRIMEWALGMYGKPTLSNLAIARQLGVTPGAVTQRKRRIQSLLDQRQEVNPFSG